MLGVFATIHETLVSVVYCLLYRLVSLQYSLYGTACSLCMVQAAFSSPGLCVHQQICTLALVTCLQQTAHSGLPTVGCLQWAAYSGLPSVQCCSRTSVMLLWVATVAHRMMYFCSHILSDYGLVLYTLCSTALSVQQKLSIPEDVTTGVHQVI